MQQATKVLQIATCLILFSFSGCRFLSVFSDRGDSPQPSYELVGHVGGTTKTLTRFSDTTYISVGARVLSVDCTVPSAPVAVGQSEILPELVLSLACDGTTVYAGCGDAGVAVIDFSVPENPKTQTIIEISDKKHIAEVLYSGDRIYVASGGQIEIFNVVDPSAPKLVGSLDGLLSQHGMAMMASRLYLAHSDSSGSQLVVIDVSDESDPLVVGSTTIPDPSIGFLGAGGVATTGSTVLAAMLDAGVAVVDVSDPENPALIGTIETDGNASHVTAIGSVAYVSVPSRGVYAYDMQNPSSPVLLGSTAIAGAIRAEIDAGWIYVASGNTGLQIFSAADPASITHAGTYLDASTGPMVAVCYHAGHAYVTADSSGMWIVDVSGAGSPTCVGNFDLPGCGIANDVQVVDDTAYIAFGLSGLVTVDISDSTNPVELGSASTSGLAQSVEIIDDLAYVAYGTSGLVVFDVENPETPVKIGSADTTGYAWGIDVVGFRAYVADGRDGLAVFDISDPRLPTELGRIPTAAPGGWATFDVTVDGDIAYVADGSVALHVIDVSDATRPLTIGLSDRVSGYARAVSYMNDLAYVSDSYEGLRVFDVSKPSDPSEIGQLDAKWDITGHVVADGFVFCAEGDAGLTVYQITE